MATERAVLAGGCFWGVQELLRKRPGDLASRAGEKCTYSMYNHRP